MNHACFFLTPKSQQGSPVANNTFSFATRMLPFSWVTSFPAQLMGGFLCHAWKHHPQVAVTQLFCENIVWSTGFRTTIVFFSTHPLFSVIVQPHLSYLAYLCLSSLLFSFCHLIDFLFAFFFFLLLSLSGFSPLFYSCANHEKNVCITEQQEERMRWIGLMCSSPAKLGNDDEEM